MRHRIVPVVLLGLLAILLSSLLLSSVTPGSAEADSSAPRASTPMASTSGCRLPWVNGTDMASLQLLYNAEADQFLAFGMKYWDVPQYPPGIGMGAFPDYQYPAALRLSGNGTPLGAPARLLPEVPTGPYDTDAKMSSLPEIAYSSAAQRYLMVWSELYQRHTPNQYGSVRAQLVDGNLLPVQVGEQYNILPDLSDPYWHETDVAWPSVTHNIDNGEFMVVWLEKK